MFYKIYKKSTNITGTSWTVTNQI